MSAPKRVVVSEELLIALQRQAVEAESTKRELELTRQLLAERETTIQLYEQLQKKSDGQVEQLWGALREKDLALERTEKELKKEKRKGKIGKLAAIGAFAFGVWIGGQ